MNWVELIIGSILGALMGYYFPLIKKKFEDSRLLKESKKRKNAFKPENIYQWLIDYYEKKGALNDLYNCRIGNFERRIPFITDKSWQFPLTICKDKNKLLRYSESENKAFPVNLNLIEKRKSLGQTLFNEPILYIDYIESIGEQFRINVKKCDYFEAITSLMEIEEETFNAFIKGNHQNLKFRDKCLSGLAISKEIMHRPLNLGCISSFVINSENRYEVLVNTRSYELVTYGGAKAVIPQFGLIPIYGNNVSENILFYNFIKEYCEELYSYDELIRKSDTKRTDPTWFYQLKEAKELIELWEKGLFRLEFLGFGFDVLNGGAIISLLALINDKNFSREIKYKINANWEVQKNAEKSIEFVNIYDSRLEDWLRQKKLQYGSAFTLSKTLEKLKTLSTNC